jgi:hypothetical protein
MINQVPVLGNPMNNRGNTTVPIQPATIQQGYPASIYHTTLPSLPKTDLRPGPTAPPPAPQPLLLASSSITSLVIGSDGRYHQSEQNPEIQALLKAAVRRGNANLAFFDAFLDIHRKGQWLAEALTKELGKSRDGSSTMEAVDDRARRSGLYFNNLLSMVIYFAGIEGNMIMANGPTADWR